jgi:hypothetical protein
MFTLDSNDNICFYDVGQGVSVRQSEHVEQQWLKKKLPGTNRRNVL